MLIQCKGFKSSNYFIPPFELHQKEIVVIYLQRSNQFYFEGLKELVAVFSGKVKRQEVNVIHPLQYVNLIDESVVRKWFYPVTVKEYVRRNANKENNIAREVYKVEYVKPSTRINTLEGTQRKLLSLYCTLSYTSAIVFDLTALSIEGSLNIHHIVKKYVNDGGAAILIDWTDDMKNDCSKFIMTEYQTTDSYTLAQTSIPPFKIKTKGE